MHRKNIISALVILIAFAFLVTPVFADKPEDKPHKKATGTVTWTARTHLDPEDQLPGLVTSFNAHEDAPGKNSERGMIETYRPTDPSFDEGTIKINVSCVNIDEDEAWFGGEAVEATGGYETYLGDWFVYHVMDMGTPGSEGDIIGGNRYSSDDACDVVENGSFEGKGMVTDGNLKVH